MSWVGPPRGASRRVICLLSRIDGYSIFETDARNRLCIVARFFCRSRVPLFIRGRPSSQMVPIETDDEVVTVPPLSRVSSGIVSHCPAPPEREGACVRTCWKAEEELLELVGWMPPSAGIGMMPAARHGGAYGGKADDTGACPCDRPHEAELPSLCNGSRRYVCGCPRFGKKTLTVVRERGTLSVVC